VLLRPPSTSLAIARHSYLRQCTVVEGELRDAYLLRTALKQQAPQTCFHLAAQSQVSAASQDPLSTFETNIAGTWHLLEACRDAGTTQVVIASSGKVYGTVGIHPYIESDPLQSRRPYNVSKACADLVAQSYAQTYGLPICTARCGNIFGGGDMNFQRVIPGLIRDTLHNERFIFRGDSRSVHDFLYVEDAVEAYLLLAENLHSNPALGGEAFNFSIGMPTSLLELSQQLLRIMGRSDLAPIMQNTEAQEVQMQALSTKKAREILGWTPNFKLEKGLTQTVSWYRKYFSGVGDSPSIDVRSTPLHIEP
jgi:CDP-glucose 4,6-dehydratase